LSPSATSDVGTPPVVLQVAEQPLLPVGHPVRQPPVLGVAIELQVDDTRPGLFLRHADPDTELDQLLGNFIRKRGLRRAWRPGRSFPEQIDLGSIPLPWLSLRSIDRLSPGGWARLRVPLFSFVLSFGF